MRPPLAWLAWIGLVLTVASGAAWFILVAASMGERPVAEVFSEDFLWVVLLQTEFGRAWVVRAILAGLLAAMFAVTLTAKRKRPTAIWFNVVAVAMAAGLIGMLAWGGHAAGGAGAEPIVHPAADFLHLTAAAAWVGALTPLALVLRAAGGDTASLAVARTATLRFSAFGAVAVGTLLVTGLINSFYLVGSIPALVGTDYGRLLAAKVALFFAMVAVAAINRFRLTPRLVPDATLAPARHVLRRLPARSVSIAMLSKFQRNTGLPPWRSLRPISAFKFLDRGRHGDPALPHSDGGQSTLPLQRAACSGP